MVELTPPQIHERWEWIRAGLLEVKAQGPVPWIPEDVYHELMKQWAILLLIEDVGFVVVKINRCSYENVLFVWALWAKTNSMWRLYRDVMAELEALAKGAGLTKIRMYSQREEWKATKLFVPVSTIYEREVQ